MKKIMLMIMGLALISGGVSAGTVQDYIDGKIVRPTCPEEKPLLDTDGFCHSCFENSVIEIYADMDLLEMCHTADGKAIREEEEDFFKDVKTYLIACPNEAPLKVKEQGCFPCDWPAAVKTEDADCAKCPTGRVYNEGWCKVSSCENKPLRDLEGNCYPCDFKEAVETSRGACTKACPNRVQNGGGAYGDKDFEYCALKDEVRPISKNCPPEKPILDHMGVCRACDFYRKSIQAISGCDKCANREESGRWFISENSGKFCYLKE